VNLVPELELVIGKQPPVADLPPQDAQRRFQMVFRRFLGVFARKEHPLALLLDDLQWLDAATLDLLESVMADAEVRYLLMVGAWLLRLVPRVSINLQLNRFDGWAGDDNKLT
jgi:predicted ATPase